MADTIDTAEIAVIGAGAAGLFAAIWAGRTLRARGVHPKDAPRVIAIDGAKKLGAKILVAGGGRCNVTHHAVDEKQYAGTSRNAIRNVLRRFDVPETVAFFAELGVELKREETGKLFPVTDDAHTVLNALFSAARDVDAQLIHPWRVGRVEKDVGGVFHIEQESLAAPASDAPAPIRARRVILATGGKALPLSGSNGQGYDLARRLGHSITDRVFPALVPLTLPRDHWICALSGITLPATLELRAATGKRLQQFTNSTLCAHFGLSGPGVLDMSRYYTDAVRDDARAQLVMCWLPGQTLEGVDAALSKLGRGTPVKWLQGMGLPERVTRSLCEGAGVDPTAPGHALTREARRALATLIVQTPLPITGDRGFTYAEVTAGGVPLSEVHLDTMESRVCPGLHLCGEILDVDGRIGGFNFQWAWASGYVAGQSAAKAVGALIGEAR
jgi:predicted Rossmann fold flavoprotein